ncbi:MAG: BadF/BadG/BcrA/BcrD ATPase family protein, partial [Candidatus Margulisiibacteriota bacterium]
MATKYYIGFDIGSDSVHTIALNEEGKMVYSPTSLMHFGNQIAALREAYDDLIKILGEENIKAVAFTGTAGKLIAETTDSPFYYDSISIPAGAEIIASGAEYIFHMGASNPYFFERVVEKDGGRAFVADHGTGTKCGGGSGILINKQIRRFFAEDFPIKVEDPDSRANLQEKELIKRGNRRKLQQQLEHMHEKALASILSSSKDLDVGGRCGVIIQSDMIHMQNSGEQIPNILKGMYRRVAKNYKSDVVRTRILDKRKQAIATGGVFLNENMVNMLSKELGLEITWPTSFEKIGAAGAALKALKEKRESGFKPADLDKVLEAQKKEIHFAPRLSSALNKIHVYPEEKAIAKTEGGLIIYKKLSSLTGVVIGVDGGSTTTKALIADAADLGIIAEICLDTNGRPLETAQEMFREIRQHLGSYLKIQGIAYTGSSGAFYYKLFTDFRKAPSIASADMIKDEITCHAYGVRRFNKRVDTIFECGGQDAKFTLFNKDGTVKKAKMNLSCMAGTGQSMK